MSRTKIEWATKVWNPVTGCTKISAGCKNCYAERMATRLAGRVGYPADEPFRVTLHPDRLGIPAMWKRPQRVFVNSMSDLFHKDVPEEFLDDVFMAMMLASRHTFLVLTKRPERMLRYITEELPFNHERERYQHVWLGVSVEDQATADLRIPLLLQTPAAVRFVSAEPLLGPVDLARAFPGTSRSPLRGGNSDGTGAITDWPNLPRLDWVICGGESGPGAQPMHPDWARSLRNQCAAAGVPFFFKQWGEWAPNCLCDTPIYSDPCRATKRPEPGLPGVMFRCGKRAAGTLLDEREHKEFPQETML